MTFSMILRCLYYYSFILVFWYITKYTSSFVSPMINEIPSVTGVWCVRVCWTLDWIRETFVSHSSKELAGHGSHHIPTLLYCCTNGSTAFLTQFTRTHMVIPRPKFREAGCRILLLCAQSRGDYDLFLPTLLAGYVHKTGKPVHIQTGIYKSTNCPTEFLNGLESGIVGCFGDDRFGLG